MAKFTVITPVFNGAKFIEETVLSVLAATVDIECEYLVIDDGSTDDTEKLLQKYHSKLQYIFQENSGQAAAINKGIKLASGAYTTIVNADDPLITSRLFLDAERIMDAESLVVATYPDWNMIDSNGNILEKIQVKDFDLVELVGRFNCLVGPGGVFRTDTAKKINGWDSSYRFVPDYDFWLRLSEFGIFRHVPEIQANWRTHESSISVASRNKAMADERVKVMSQHLERNPNIPAKIKKMAIAHSHYRASVLSYFDSQINGRKLLFASVTSYPRILFEKDIRVSAYVLLLPISRFALNFLNRFEYFRNATESLRISIKR